MKDTRYAVVLVYTDTDGFLPLVQLADKNSLFQTKKEAVAAANPSSRNFAATKPSRPTPARKSRRDTP